MKTSLWLGSVLLGFGVAGCGADSNDPAGAGSTSGGGSTAVGESSSGVGGAGGAGSTSGGDGGASSGNTSSGGTGGGPCQDACPAPNGGVTIACEKRFFYGVNYAWGNFGGDFGGITAYGGGGIAQHKAERLADLKDMRASGVDVVRWWVFPDLRGDGIKLDGNGSPTGLGGTLIADLDAALDIAEQADVHIQLCLFSFDAFKGDPVHGNNIASIVSTPAKQADLINNVVKPIAAAVKSSPNHDRLSSWDIINEPEWATSGDDGVDQPFTPTSGLTTVPYATMKGFIDAISAALHAGSDRPVTVGSAAVKWAKAWTGPSIDFYTFHMYDWVNQYWPYTTPLAQLGVADKPVVLGEFPLTGLSGVSYSQLVNKLFDLGYAGAMGWSVTDTAFGPWDTVKVNVASFATEKGCVVSY